MNWNSTCRMFPLGVLGLLLVLSPSWGQSVNSSLQGVVTDTSGASVPEATVNLTNTRTGTRLTTETDNVGLYSFPSLPPGVYSLEVTKPGFARYQLSQFTLVVGQHATENVTLSISTATQTVTVSAAGLADLLQPESNDLGNVIAPQSVAQLPLNGETSFNSACSLEPPKTMWEQQAARLAKPVILPSPST